MKTLMILAVSLQTIPVLISFPLFFLLLFHISFLLLQALMNTFLEYYSAAGFFRIFWYKGMDSEPYN